VDAAVDGDTVYVCPGVHVQQILVPEERVMTLASWSGNAEDTVLDGHHKWTILMAHCMSDVTVSGLTFRNGNGEQWDNEICTESLNLDLDGGAIYSLSSRLAVEGCVFQDNYAEYSGGAVHLQGGDACCGDRPGAEVVVVDSSFINNQAGYGGGALDASAGYGDLVVQVDGCQFDGNTAGHGGGAVNVGGYWNPWGALDTSVADCSFENNVAGWGGGAFHLSSIDHPTNLLISNSDFIDGSTVYCGGGVSLQGRTTLDASIVDTLFQGNSSLEQGGSLALLGSVGTGEAVAANLERVVLNDGTATDYGAAISFELLDEGSGVTLTDCEVTSNRVTSGLGGAVYFGASPGAVVTSVNTNWGEGVDDNDPGDLSWDNPASGCFFYDAGVGANFTCDGSGPGSCL
jgi:predicted outer membrane repeat protein